MRWSSSSRLPQMCLKVLTVYLHKFAMTVHTTFPAMMKIVRSHLPSARKVPSTPNQALHALMIQDKVRTSTQTSFILQTPSLFCDTVVLDVGCSTGILSLFAACGGTKRVIAVDASTITEKAEQIVKANQLDNIITWVPTTSLAPFPPPSSYSFPGV